ncbi:hypothetical protein [Novosphingobium colocasiae]|uniref:hypothetical protein n=1 Tax=Novosphingobium colocasiae TaxID=1256513 RepID=UPI0035ADE62E
MSASTTPMTPERQLELFKQAVAALGGHRRAAAVIGCTERTMSRLLSGQQDLHDGWLADLSAALIAHADQCRLLERQLSPDFSANRIPGQARPDARRTRWEDR